MTQQLISFQWSSPVRLVVAVLLVGLMHSTATAQFDADVQEKFQEGQMLVQDEEFGEAAEIFQELVESNEDLGPAWFFLGYSLHMDGQLEEALKAHKKAAEFDQFAGIATYNVACAHALMHDSNAAMESLMDAVENGFDDVSQMEIDSDLNSLHTDVRFAKLLADLDGEEEIVEKLNEAEEHLGSGDFAKAAEVYKAILEDDKRNFFATYRLGYALHGAGDLEEALVYHTKATKFEGVAPVATYNIACVHSLQDNKDEAFAHLEKAVALGFIRMDALHEDPDLENIRADDRFKEIVAKVEAIHASHGHDDHDHDDSHEHDDDHGDDHEHGDHDHDEKDDKDDDG